MKYDHYLSFGFICELSFALQSEGIFTPAYLSWADIRGTNALIDTLKNPEKLFSGHIKKYAGNMFFCNQLKVGFHGKQQFSDCITAEGEPDQTKINNSLIETKDRIGYLHKKTEDIILNNNCLIIVKWVNDAFDEPYTPYESSKLLSSTLNLKFNKNIDTLYIFEKSTGFPEWTEKNSSGRHIEAFAPRSRASKINTEHWSNVLSEFK